MVWGRLPRWAGGAHASRTPDRGEPDRLAEILTRLGSPDPPDHTWRLPSGWPELSSDDTGQDGEHGVDSADPGVARGAGRHERPPRPEGPAPDADDTEPFGRHREPPAHRRLLSRPSSLVGARVHPTWAGVAALVVAACVLALAVGWRAWQQQSEAAPQPAPPAVPAGTAASPGSPAAPSGGPAGPGRGSEEDQAPTTPTEGSAGAGAPAAPTPPARVVVHVAGQVREPGVVELPAGARVQQALEAAGGVAGDADTGRLNLARVLVDGERVWVPAPGEEVPAVLGPEAGPAGPPGTPGSVPPAAGADPPSSGPLDLNTADAAALDTLPGIGPVLAERIVAWRTENGAFTAVEDLLEVSGIGEAVLGDVRDLVTV